MMRHQDAEVRLHANVLIALLNTDHVHHRATRRWFADLQENFATCPVTEGALARFAFRGGRAAEDVEQLIGMVSQHPRRPAGGRLATFDKGLAQFHGDVAELIPV